ncbi:MAG: pyrroloquinoline quinone biosynthesis protein PqqB [Chloroflexi bacterium]|nr:pyrroloquinoline quinone biosynthesis protein PqqB [Chloroflexota bacterium]
MSFPPNQVTAVILGIMQDGGLPHIGCRCDRCAAAYEAPRQTEYAACLALVDTRQTPPLVYLIDATPDIKFQLDLLADVLGMHPQRPYRLRQPDGIFLTHGHMGHTAGLAQLGPEAMAVEGLRIFAASDLNNLLLATPLWSPLVERLQLTPLIPGQALDLAPDLQITAVPVPHRDEWGAGTATFVIQGPNRRLLYLPDIDNWDDWPNAAKILASVDVALVDASFYSADELGGRPPVAHPLVPDTIERFAHLPTQLVLTHINHTNPILDEDSAAWTAVHASGVQIAYTGQQFLL